MAQANETKSTADTLTVNKNLNVDKNLAVTGTITQNGSQVISGVTAAAGSNIGSVGTPSVTASTSNGKTTLTFDYLKGAKGDKGDTGTAGGTGPQGVGISTIKKTSTSGLVDTYTITKTDNSTATFTVTNGAKGDSGTNGTNGTNGVTPTIKASSGANIGSVGTPSVTASTSGTTTTFTFDYLKGAKGDKGDTGSVASVETTGSGNAVTSVTMDANKKVTVTKGATFLTSHQTLPTSLKNPNAIKFKNASGTEVSYDGSAAKDLTGGVYYATTAGSATNADNTDKLDGYHATSFVKSTGNITASGFNRYATVNKGNTNVFPYNKIAHVEGTHSWGDLAMLLYITADYNGAGFGLLRVSLRSNDQTSTASSYQYISCEANWLVRRGLGTAQVIIGYNNVKAAWNADVFLITNGVYDSYSISQLEAGCRGSITGATWELISAVEKDNSTTASTNNQNCYATLAAAGTYTNTVYSTDAGYVQSAGSATKATQDGNGNNIASTYLPLSGGTLSGALTFSGESGTTAAGSVTKILFNPEAGTSQQGYLWYSDYDSYQAPAALTFGGAQGGEYFIAPNIKATSDIYEGTSKLSDKYLAKGDHLYAKALSASSSSVIMASGLLRVLYSGTGGSSHTLTPNANASLLCGNALLFTNPATKNDQAWIRLTGTGESDQCLEIATGDDGTQDFNVHFRGYNTSSEAAVDIVLPKTSGTVALTSNIPTVPTKTSELTNDSDFATQAWVTSQGYKTTDTNTITAFRGTTCEYVGSVSGNSAIWTPIRWTGGTYGCVYTISGRTGGTTSWFCVSTSTGASFANTSAEIVGGAFPYVSGAVASFKFIVPAGETYYVTFNGSWTYVRYARQPLSAS